MKTYFRKKRLLTLLSAGLLSVASAVAQTATHLVISQVYGAGGGATPAIVYNVDYVELYNPTSTPIDLTGLSLEYGSSAGVFGSSAANIKTFTGGTVQPGKYFLVAATSKGTAGADLPVTADDTMSLSLAAGAGKVALVTGSASTPAAGCAASNVVDEVTYGGGGSCSEGAGPAPALGNTLAAIRTDPTQDSNNNAADFMAATPNPHNSSSGGTTPPPVTSLGITSATASPSNAVAGAGAPVTFTVVVTPATASTGIVVSADLSQVGGSASQNFALGSTANTYTYTMSVPGGIAVGTYSLPVSAKDDQNDTANGTISLMVTAAGSTTPIATLQAARASYVGTKVTTTGVVTAVINNTFFIQTPSSTPGSTGVAEGLDVYTGGAPTVHVGDNVDVTGMLSFFPATTSSHIPALELSSPAITVNSTGNVLPKPITVTGKPTASGGLYQLTQYESMRVLFPSLTTVSGTDGSLDEPSETVTSSGELYAVSTGTTRPFREPGMDFRDFPTATCVSITNCTATATVDGVARAANLVLFDDNPERLLVETSLAGGTPIDQPAGAVLTGVTGVLDFSATVDTSASGALGTVAAPPRVLIDPATPPAVTASPLTPTALPLPKANQFTIGAFNIERFYNTNAADNLYMSNVTTGKISKTSAATLTTDAYSRRLKKVSLAIRTVLNNPDIISVEEVENLSVLQDIAAQIDADTTTGTKPGYQAYSTDSVTKFTNDGTGISVGFLVKPATVSVVKWEQVGATTQFTPTGGTSAQTLNDRPSQVLHATINRGTGVAGYPITVISNHFKALTGVDDTKPNTREKKELQAEMLANLIQGYQKNGEHVVAVGDFNAFQFSDGYTDTLGTVTGNVGNGVSAEPGMPITNPAAVDLVNSLAPELQQSYTFQGNAQVLDHVVVTADIAASTTLAFGHIDADFPLTDENLDTTPARESDHDPALAYLTLPGVAATGTLTGATTFPGTNVGASSTGQQITLTNTGATALTITTIATTGDFSQTNNCGSSLAAGANCLINVAFTPTASGARSGTLTVTSNGTVPAATLTGTGVALTLVGSLSAPADFGQVAVGSSSQAQAITLTNTGTGALTVMGVAVTGAFSQTNNCPATLTAGANCAIGVVFKPTAAGAATGTLTVNSNATGPITAALQGTGMVVVPTFTLSSPTVTIAAGATSTSSLTITAVNGFAGSVDLTCTGPTVTGAGCLVTNSVMVPAGGTGTASVLISTTARTAAGGLGAVPRDGRLVYAMLAMLMAGGLFAVRKSGRNVRMGGLLALLFALAMGMTGCAGGTPANPNGTPAGTYKYTVTGTGGGQTVTSTVTVTVQ